MKSNIYKFIIVIFFLVVVDQLIKYIVNLNNFNMPINIINGIVQLNYVQNFGIAFGIAKGGKAIFIIVNIIIIGIIFKILFTQSNKLNYRKKILISVILAGGIGNLIDRIFRGYVIDYIDITQMINYPVFNFADIMIVLGTVGICIFIIKDIINENNINKKKEEV